jgi:hypothetical protein
MRDVRELLAEKEAEAQRVRTEVESLQAVIPLLTDDRLASAPNRKPVSSVQAAAGNDLAASAASAKSRFWKIGKRWRDK